jgi:hypothetical protein
MSIERDPVMRTKLLCLPILLLSSLLLGCSQKKKDYSITSGNSSSQEGPIESSPSAPRISESRMPLPSRFVVDHVKYALSGDTAIAQGLDEDSLGEKEISIGLTKDSDFSYTIPCKIGVFAFKDCSRLKKVSFRGEILGIGYGAFRFCSSLTSVSIPSSVQYIGQGAFAGCDSLEAITVEKENPNFSSENGGLYNKDGTVLLSGPGAKKEFQIPERVVNIQEFAFCGCRNLQVIEIPSSVTWIGETAFLNCPSLGLILVSLENTSYTTFDNVLYDIGKKLPVKCPEKKKKAKILSTVTRIGGYAFFHCAHLISIAIPSSVTEIGDYAFSQCFFLDIFCGSPYSLYGFSPCWNDFGAKAYWYSRPKE